MIIRNTVIAAAALTLAIGLSSCGSDDSADAPDTAAALTASQPAAAPAAEELQNTLVVLLDPARPAAEKTTVVVTGDGRLPVLEQVTAGLAGYGQITTALSDVHAEGTTAFAKVAVTSPHGTMPDVPMTWENVDGHWKLSDASTCTIASMARVTCE